MTTIAGVEERVEVAHLVAALRGRLRRRHRGLPDAAERGAVTAGPVHDDRVVVDELPEGAQAVLLGPVDGRIEVHPVEQAVLCTPEDRIVCAVPPGRDVVVAEARVRVACRSPRAARAGTRRAGCPARSRVLLDELQHVGGARGEADQPAGVAATVADVLDVAVLGRPLQGRVLGARDQLHGDVALRRRRQIAFALLRRRARTAGEQQ